MQQLELKVASKSEQAGDASGHGAARSANARTCRVRPLFKGYWESLKVVGWFLFFTFYYGIFQTSKKIERITLLSSLKGFNEENNINECV